MFKQITLLSYLVEMCRNNRIGETGMIYKEGDFYFIDNSLYIDSRFLLDYNSYVFPLGI
jgi:hypothetical protein